MGKFAKRFLFVVSFQVRLMKDRDTGENKGYAFVAFKTKEVAQKAIEEIHSREFKVFTMLPENLVVYVLFSRQISIKNLILVNGFKFFHDFRGKP